METNQSDIIAELTKARDCCLEHSEADDIEIKYLHGRIEHLEAINKDMYEALNNIEIILSKGMAVDYDYIPSVLAKARGEQT